MTGLVCFLHLPHGVSDNFFLACPAVPMPSKRAFLSAASEFLECGAGSLARFTPSFIGKLYLSFFLLFLNPQSFLDSLNNVCGFLPVDLHSALCCGQLAPTHSGDTTALPFPLHFPFRCAQSYFLLSPTSCLLAKHVHAFLPSPKFPSPHLHTILQTAGSARSVRTKLEVLSDTRCQTAEKPCESCQASLWKSSISVPLTSKQLTPYPSPPESPSEFSPAKNLGAMCFLSRFFPICAFLFPFRVPPPPSTASCSVGCACSLGALFY
eukprot:RCo015979